MSMTEESDGAGAALSELTMGGLNIDENSGIESGDAVFKVSALSSPEPKELMAEISKMAGPPPAAKIAQQTANRIAKLQSRMEGLSCSLSSVSFVDTGDNDDIVAAPVASSLLDRNRAEIRKLEEQWTDALYSTARVAKIERERTLNRAASVVVATSTNGARSKMVEFAEFPGFSDGYPCDLPGISSAKEYMQQALSANSMLFGGPKEKFGRYFLSGHSLAMVGDVFWWCWLDRFGAKPSKASRGIDRQKDEIFSRIANTFVSLYQHIPTSYRDHFFKLHAYPDLLSQAMYCAFANIFPDSSRDFHAEFKTWMVCIITEWTTGVTPAPGTWRDWKLAFLEPSLGKQREDVEGAGGGSSPDRQTSATSTDAARMLRQDSYVEPVRSLLERRVIHPDANYKTLSVLFDVSGHTPLMAQYLKSHGMGDTTGGAVFVHRTQLQADASSEER